MFQTWRQVSYEEGLGITKFVGHSMITKNVDFISILRQAFLKYLNCYGKIWHNAQ
jgi:hypothetical protein